jgi:hypothetical protein
MENKTGALPAPPKAPNTWIAYVQKVSGASYQHTSGAEAKTFLGYSHATHVGLKSELSAGGFFKNIVGPDFSMQFAPRVGGKKDKSWGDKREWRKGDISLRCIGKKEDFVFSQADLTSFSPVGSFSAAKTEKTRLDNDKSVNLAQTKKLETIRDAVAQIHNDFSNIREISTSTLKLNATVSAKINATALDLAAGQSLSLKGAKIDIAAPSVNVKGKVSLGGIAIPPLATAAQLTKLQAKLTAQNAKITALKAQGAALYAKAMTQLLPT